MKGGRPHVPVITGHNLSLFVIMLMPALLMSECMSKLFQMAEHRLDIIANAL